jgi:hypothetical protein
VKRFFDRLFGKRPWLVALLLLACGLVNAYEAVYIRPDSVMSIVDWVFAAVCGLCFVAFVLRSIADYLSKADD